MIARDTFYIDGRWTQPRSSQTIDVTDPSTGRLWARVPQGAGEDVEAAMAAAVQAFGTWSRTPPAERSVVMERVAAELAARADVLTTTIASEVGMPIKIARRVQVAGPLVHWNNYAKLARDFCFEKKVGNSLVMREAAGVVVAITPWNFPFSQITLKVAAALAAGCAVVLKPSEIAPINAFILAEALDAAGVPPGVFNLITGLGIEVGEQLVSHPGADVISFTGSTQVGRRVGEIAGRGIRKVTLELGGKSASVVLDDADFEKAVKSTVGNCFLNSGQTCSALTRLLVPRSRLKDATCIAQEAAERFKVGPALADGSMLGPLVSEAQRQRVWGYIDQAINDGATLVCGGSKPPEGLTEGFFVRPTVLMTDDPYVPIAQEEVFGPVLTILPYDGDEDAVRIANATPYGLAGAVWGATDDRALAIAKRIRAGQVDINGGSWNPEAPFGGYALSGLGRECGIYGLEEYLEYKSLQLRAVG